MLKAFSTLLIRGITKSIGCIDICNSRMLKQQHEILFNILMCFLAEGQMSISISLRQIKVTQISHLTLVQKANTYISQNLPWGEIQRTSVDHRIYFCRLNIRLVGLPMAFLSSCVSTNAVSCSTLGEFTTRPWTLSLGNCMTLRRLCHVTQASVTRGPCTPKHSTAPLSNPGSSYCCWQLRPVPSAGGIRWEWVRRRNKWSRPKETSPRPITQLGIIRSCWRQENMWGERETWQADRGEGGLLSHLIWQSKNTRNLQCSHHTSSPRLHLHHRGASET